MMASALWPPGLSCGRRGCSQLHRGLEQVQAVRQGGIPGAGRWASPHSTHPAGLGSSVSQPQPLIQTSRSAGNAPALGLRSLALECRGAAAAQTPTRPDPRPLLIRCVGVARTHLSSGTRIGRSTDKWEKHLLFSVEDARSLWKWREACSKSQKFRAN